jgi:hypothetical protein
MRAFLHLLLHGLIVAPTQPVLALRETRRGDANIAEAYAVLAELAPVHGRFAIIRAPLAMETSMPCIFRQEEP